MDLKENSPQHVDLKRTESPRSLEKADASSRDGSRNPALEGFTAADHKRIKRKIDTRLVLTLGLMYCVSLMDRTNMPNAAIAGMTVELNMYEPEVAIRYSIATLVFFSTYTIFQPGATVLTRKIGPKIFLAGICCAWGAVMIGMGFVASWTQLTGLRVLLGVFEAGFFPGCVYLISTWFVRYDTGKRYGVFYLIGSLASALSGILAYGLSRMEGVAGYTGWRWIFIMEGIITVLLGIAGYILIVPFPDQEAWKSRAFLTQREVEYVIALVDADRGDAHTERFTIGRFLRPGLQPKVWGFAMMFLCTTTMAYAIAYFLPIILSERMGFSIAASQCLVAPPYAWGAILMYAESWLGDKYHVRGPQILSNCLMGIVGLAIMGWTGSVGSQYFGVFVLTGAVQANIPQVMSYQANNIRGQWTRAFCSASLVGSGGIGGIAGSLIFRPQDAPEYIPGLWACMTCCLIIGAICITLDLTFWRKNKKAEAGQMVLEGGDTSFRYTL